MKKLLVFAIIVVGLTLGLMAHYAHGAETLSTNYWQGWNEDRDSINGWELYWAGYPQFGQGQWTHTLIHEADGTIRQIRDDEKAPGVPYSVYYPTPTEMRQWAQANSGQPVTVYMVDRGSSVTFRAVSGNVTGKDGIRPSEALSNLLLKQRNVPYYSTGGQILWFLYGQN
jgi:hypothetical protein